MTNIRTLDGVELAGKRVLLRLDLNVPRNNQGEISDPTRIDRIVPSLCRLLDKKAAVMILAHFDRPQGKVVDTMSLKPIAVALSQAIGRPVGFVKTDWQSLPTIDLEPGDCVLLENIRFSPDEERDCLEFAKCLASLGDIYINDAFSAAHRAHASTHAITQFLPSYAGYTLQAELKTLEAFLSNPERPLIAVVGGAKISTKLALLENLLDHTDMMVIGGGMANNFIAASGYKVGKSLVETDLIAQAKQILDRTLHKNCQLILPTDLLVAKKLAPHMPYHVATVDNIQEDEMILDLGPKSCEAIEAAFLKAKTLIWNGPLGAFETPPFDQATNLCARTAARLTKSGHLKTIAGGGDTISALNHAGVARDFTYLSTAGGAFLEWLEGKTLPGIKALENGE